jgi:uncharacterized membrane protein YfcA
MVLAFGVDLRYAVGASLVAVIATSLGAAAGFLRRGLVNVRVGVLLEGVTVVGAILGAVLAGLLPREAIAITFGLVALYSAWGSLRPPAPSTIDLAPPDPVAARLALGGTCDAGEGPASYTPRRIPAACAVMAIAGVLSAVVGVGGGILKVLAMDRLMRMPFKASTATSTFMIGVTAAASVAVYFRRGQLEPDLCAPIALGAVLGAGLGARLLPRLRTRTLRVVFALLVAASGVEMIRRALGGFA